MPPLQSVSPKISSDKIEFSRQPLGRTLGIFIRAAVRGLSPGNDIPPRFRIFGAIALALVSIFLIPAHFCKQPEFGLDASWRLLLNKAVSEVWTFGIQLVWTYGPLGILEARLPFGVNRYYYALFDAFMLLGFLRLALDSAKLKIDRSLALGLVVTLGCAKELICSLPSSAFFCLIIFLIVRNLSQPSLAWSAALAFSAAVMCFFKWNFGLIGFFLCLCVFLCKLCSKDKQWILWLGILVVELMLVIGLASRFHVDLFEYIKTGFITVKNYNEGMVAGPGRGGIAHILICLCFCCYLVMAAQVIRKRPKSRETLYLLITTVAIFVLYKTAIVRSDYEHHNRCFIFGFPLLALSFLLTAPGSLSTLWRRLFLASSFYAALLLVFEHGGSLVYLKKDDLKAFFPISYTREFATFEQHRTWDDYTNQVQRLWPERCLPEHARAVIGNSPVDVFPYDATIAMASGLTYRPRPIPQSYAAIGPELEAKNLEFFRSEKSPPIVLYVLGPRAGGINDRYSMFDEPALKRLLQQDYSCQLVFTNVQGGPEGPPPGPTPVLLLERKSAAPSFREIPVETKIEAASNEFALPMREGELYAKINIRKSWLGRIVGLVYRRSKVRIELALASGDKKVFGIIPANLESGVLVSHFIDDSDPGTSKDYFCAHPEGNPRIVRMKIEFDCPWQYQSWFGITYFYVSPGP